ncbi:MAG: hypothetical protein ACLTXL_04160 [Clostridia bacterium]
MHMSPEDAAAFSVHDKQLVYATRRQRTGEEVPVRVDKSYSKYISIPIGERP